MPFFKRSKGKSYRIFFASDLHGSDRCFRKFVNSAKHYRADALVCGGDLTGKMIVPLVERDDGSVRARFMDREIVASEDGIADLHKRLTAAGYYPYQASEEEIGQLDEAAIERLFADVISARLREWMNFAEERLDDSDARFFWMAGNDDSPIVDEIMSSSERVIFADGRRVEVVGGWEMITLGVSNETPWNCPRDISEDEIGRRIDALAGEVTDFRKCVFNVHVPPHNTRLDQAPELDSDLRPKLESGGLRLASVGSVAVRDALERYGPALSLHGHIHESGGVDRIGETVCINPGSEYQEGILRGALVILSEEGGVRDWASTTG